MDDATYFCLNNHAEMTIIRQQPLPYNKQTGRCCPCLVRGVIELLRENPTQALTKNLV